MLRDLDLNYVTWQDYPGTPSIPGASDLNRLQNTSVFLAQTPLVIATRNQDQTVSSGTFAAVGFNQDVIDTDRFHNIDVSAFTDFVCPKAGAYDLRAQVQWGPSAAGYRSLRIVLNDTRILGRQDTSPVGVTGIGTTQSLAAPLARLVVGDKVQVIVLQTSGAPLTVEGGGGFSPLFSMSWVRQ